MAGQRAQDATNEKIRLGISACLRGQKVRYDGDHRRDPFLVETFGRFVEWVPVCPEVECGLGVPREPITLNGDPSAPRLTTASTHVDLTDRFFMWAQRRADALEKANLCGFVFKSNSPSCGVHHVPVYDGHGAARRTGIGLFARLFIQRFPLVPCEDDERLEDPDVRESFITRIFCLRRYRQAVGRNDTLAALTEFHPEHKAVLMAHSAPLCRQMGQLVADAHSKASEEVLSQYQTLLLNALSRQATVRKHVDVLYHLAGHLKQRLSAKEKAELTELIEGYSRGLVPLVVPVTLLRHLARMTGEPHLNRQFYLNPHPTEWKLRTHA